jgi:hypothetical protein
MHVQAPATEVLILERRDGPTQILYVLPLHHRPSNLSRKPRNVEHTRDREQSRALTYVRRRKLRENGDAVCLQREVDEIHERDEIAG